ncbi:hypothetical protein ABQJ54_10815 [Rhodanobacter sp. Si-c]|uniref:Uncharacterized protein n=1 Tax=Rhodanobacter lycopersici TaxID=3162487 RepID=A0ABV3QFI2_9GAMM
MSDKPVQDELDDRFELQRMLREIEAEAREKPQAPVKQSEIQDLIKNRKKRDPHG